MKTSAKNKLIESIIGKPATIEFNKFLKLGELIEKNDKEIRELYSKNNLFGYGKKC